MSTPSRDPHWLHPDEREAILQRNITDDTPLVERQRDIARLLDLAARSRRTLDAAEAAEAAESSADSGSSLPLPLI